MCIRDSEGIVQIVAEPSDAAGNAEVLEAASKVGYEDCLRITGTVRRRQSVNDKIKTGQIELVATRIAVSYTHLDVYKRQERERGRIRQPNPDGLGEVRVQHLLGVLQLSLIHI